MDKLKDKKRKIANKMSSQDREDFSTRQMIKRAKLKNQGVKATHKFLD